MQKWEYLLVVAMDGRPRYIHGQELRDWQRGPNILDYLNQLGDQGWELVNFDSGAYMFKRPKP